MGVLEFNLKILTLVLRHASYHLPCYSKLEDPSKTLQKQPSEVLLRKGVLKICSKFTREHPCRSVISINQTSAWVFSCKFAAYF